ncbi:MAG: redox-sensing transcriptional repressor Rex [Lachnospiraceae bacterium]|nr:redox-sensing transcriptional repressor Rex [Lachnospiraceae bacterium]
MKKRKISDAVIRRLPRYYRYLDDLHSKGIVRISSSSLGERMDITASQIRQDLSCFGEFGQQGYGYNILELRTEIGHILGVDEGHRLVVVGAGHLGHALLRNFDFEQTGFLLDTAFDISPALIGTRVNNILIRPFDELEDYFAACHPDVAVLTVPSVPTAMGSTVGTVTDILVAAGSPPMLPSAVLPRSSPSATISIFAAVKGCRQMRETPPVSFQES